MISLNIPFWWRKWKCLTARGVIYVPKARLTLLSWFITPPSHCPSSPGQTGQDRAQWWHWKRSGAGPSYPSSAWKRALKPLRNQPAGAAQQPLQPHRPACRQVLMCECKAPRIPTSRANRMPGNPHKSHLFGVLGKPNTNWGHREAPSSQNESERRWHAWAWPGLVPMYKWAWLINTLFRLAIVSMKDILPHSQMPMARRQKKIKWGHFYIQDCAENHT